MTTVTESFSLPADPNVIADVRSVGERRSYPAGHVLASQGQVERCFYVIEEGVTSVTRVDEEGQLHLLDHLGPSSYFGEMGVLDDSPRFATVQAVTDVTVLEIDQERFETLVSSNPALLLSIVQRVLKSFRQLDNQTITSLREKNTLLETANRELREAQAQLIEKERLEREMELAAEVQRRLLPGSLPILEGLSFAAHLAPARMVGGDLYDIRLIDDDHVGLLLADVADKGLKAALFMAVARTLFFQESGHSLSPADVAQRVHDGLMAIGGADDGAYGDVFVTAFYGVLERPTGELTYIRAAQDRPLLLRQGEEPFALPGDGRFLGMLDGLELEEHVVHLKPGDVLLMMSDGIPDAQNPAGEAFGNERLLALLRGVSVTEANETIETVLEGIHQWMSGAPLFDDLTLVAVSLDRAQTAKREAVQ